MDTLKGTELSKRSTKEDLSKTKEELENAKNDMKLLLKHINLGNLTRDPNISEEYQKYIANLRGFDSGDENTDYILNAKRNLAGNPAVVSEDIQMILFEWRKSIPYRSTPHLQLAQNPNVTEAVRKVLHSYFSSIRYLLDNQ